MSDLERKFIITAELRDLEEQRHLGDISYSRMIELLNEKASDYARQQVIKGKITEKQLRNLAKKACNGNQHAMRYQNMLSACFEMGKMVLEELESQKLILELKQLETPKS